MLKLPMPAPRSGAGNPRPFARRFLVLATGAAIAGSAAVAVPAHAAEVPDPATSITTAAAPKQLGYRLKAGPWLAKHSGFKTEWIGALVVDGKLGICDDYGLSAPDGKWNDKPSRRRPGDDKATQVEQYLSNAYPNAMTTSNRTAAAYKAAIGLAVDGHFESDWKASYIPQLQKIDPAAIKLAHDWLGRAQSNAGPVKVVASTTKPAPGGKGSITLKATGNGNPLTNAAVTWKVSGATITKASKATSSKGSAVLTFTRGAGPVSYSAVVTSPEWRSSIWSRPTSGKKQHLIRGGVFVKTMVSGRFDSLLAVSTSSACGTACDGSSTGTFGAKASTSPMQVRALSSGKPVKTLTLAAGESGKTSFGGHDGATYGFEYRVQVAGKWSGWRTVKGFTVVCPAWPTWTLAKSCPCKGGGSASYVVKHPGGTRTYDVTLNGHTEHLVIGGSATLSTAVKAGDDVQLSFTAFDSSGKQIGAGTLDHWTQLK